MTLEEKIDSLLGLCAESGFNTTEAMDWYSKGAVTCTWSGSEEFCFYIEGISKDQPEITFSLKHFEGTIDPIHPGFSSEVVACQFWLKENYVLPEFDISEGKIYTREGMMRRVLAE